jgi:hypothetical protein
MLFATIHSVWLSGTWWDGSYIVPITWIRGAPSIAGTERDWPNGYPPIPALFSATWLAADFSI